MTDRELNSSGFIDGSKILARTTLPFLLTTLICLLFTFLLTSFDFVFVLFLLHLSPVCLKENYTQRLWRKVNTARRLPCYLHAVGSIIVKCINTNVMFILCRTSRPSTWTVFCVPVLLVLCILSWSVTILVCSTVVYTVLLNCNNVTGQSHQNFILSLVYTQSICVFIHSVSVLVYFVLICLFRFDLFSVMLIYIY